MKIESILQKDNVNTLKDEILGNSSKSLKKMYAFLGNIKETGMDILEELLIDNKSRKLIVFAYDKKNTTKKMLDTVLNYTQSVYVYNNNSENEFDSNVWIFEYEKKAIVYLLSGSVTLSSLSTDTHIYTRIEYNIEDTYEKKDYMSYISNLVDITKSNIVEKLTKELAKKLLEEKEIFTPKQYVYNVPSLADLVNNGTIKRPGYSSKEEEKESIVDDVVEKVELPHIELDLDDDFSFDIDIGDAKEKEIEIVEEERIESKELDVPFEVDAGEDKEYFLPQEDVELVDDDTEDEEEFDGVIDLENEIFASETIKIDKKKINGNKKKKEDENISKKIDLNKVSNLIMELPKRPTKGKEIEQIKIPNYIKDMLPSFFETLNNAKMIERDGSKYKEQKIEIEIIDVNTSKKYLDNNARLSQKTGQTYISFISEKLSDIKYDEEDIVRIIKLSTNSYHIEIIPKEIDEYEFWKKLCTKSFRAGTRSYGMM